MSSSCFGSLFFYVSTFRSMCAVPNIAVFCSSLTSWFPGMSLTYFLNDLEMVPVSPIISIIIIIRSNLRAFAIKEHGNSTCLNVNTGLQPWLQELVMKFVNSYKAPCKDVHCNLKS